MELPTITLPQINLPFDIPFLLHPAVVHFVVAIPVIVLLLELYNLFFRRKSIGAFSFFLLLITVVMMVVAFLTGNVDGKEAFDVLVSDGKTELKAHKLLGTYLVFVSVGVVLFKFLAMTGKGFFKFLFFMVLIVYIALILKQGKDGGELVYAYGANIEQTKRKDIGNPLEKLCNTKEASTSSAKSMTTAVKKEPEMTTASIPTEAIVKKTNESKVSSSLEKNPKQHIDESQEESKQLEENTSNVNVVE